MRTSARGFRDLSLFWKLLVPYFTLIVIIGVLGAFLIVRELSGRAEASINEDLSRRSLAANAGLRDRELYLLESGAFAANVQGMAAAVEQRDRNRAGRLLASVLALKTDLSLAVTTTRDGRGLAEFVNPERGALQPSTAGRDWAAESFVAQALTDPDGDKASGFLTVDGTTMLALASPICSSSPTCTAVGVAIVAMSADRLLVSTNPTSGSVDGVTSETGVSIYSRDGGRLAATGKPLPEGRPAVTADRPVRRLTGQADDQVATLYTPLLVQARNQGTLAVSISTQPAFGSVRSAALRLALIVLAAMLGIVGIGAVLSRHILGQVRPLLDTLRSIGSGDLGARAHRVADDELGQLADGLNTMAAQLQSSYETLEQRVEERTEQVQRLLRERTQFFAAMSHEFRTPVAVVLSQAQMLSDPQFPKSDRWQADAGRILRTSGEQLLSLVSDILELAKAEVGKLEVELGEVSVPAVVKELKPTVEGLARAAHLRTRVSVPARLPAVLADPQRLRQVLLNLVDNAVKYTPGGGTVSICATCTGAQVELAVCDTGVGIPAQDADRVFEPFFRVHTNRTQAGQPSSGLGLAVAKRLVEAQGGTIRFTSTPGEGTTFVVAMPVAGAGTEPAGDDETQPHVLTAPGR